jgi:hypothetical protein
MSKSIVWHVSLSLSVSGAYALTAALRDHTGGFGRVVEVDSIKSITRQNEHGPLPQQV